MFLLLINWLIMVRTHEDNVSFTRKVAFETMNWKIYFSWSIVASASLLILRLGKFRNFGAIHLVKRKSFNGKTAGERQYQRRAKAKTRNRKNLALKEATSELRSFIYASYTMPIERQEKYKEKEKFRKERHGLGERERYFFICKDRKKKINHSSFESPYYNIIDTQILLIS